MPVRRAIVPLLVQAAITAGVLVLALTETQPTRALHRLTTSLGSLPNGALLSGTRPSHARSSATRDVDSWPAEIALLAASADRWTSSRDGYRFRAAIELHRGHGEAGVSVLERGLRLFPSDAVLLNDLSAAHLVAALSAPDFAALHLSRALENAVEASGIRRGWPTPQHNRDAALTALGIGIDGSAADWLPPGLDAEAIARCAADACETVAVERAQEARELLEMGLLSRWSTRLLAGAPEANQVGAAFDRLADVRKTQFGDVFFSETSAVIRHTKGDALRKLAAAHAAYAKGRALYDDGKREEALREFEAARAGMARVGSPFEHEAAMQHTVVTYQLRNLDDAVRSSRRLRALAIARRYPALAARASWILGLARMQQGAIEDAIDALDAARAGYQRLHEPENVASVANSAADTLRISGDVRRGWSLLSVVARAFRAISSPQRRYLVLFNLSLYAQDEGLWHAAEIYQDGAVAAADRRGQVLTMVESRLRRAQLRLRRAAMNEARGDIEEATRLLPTVVSAASREYLEQWRDRLQLHARRGQDDRAASAGFEALVLRFERTEPAEIPSLYLEAARASRAAGDLRRASDLYRLGIRSAATRRELLSTDEFRITHFSTQWDLYHELIDAELARDPIRALVIAEEARSALTTREASIADPQPFHIPPLAANESLFYYAVLRDRIVLWIVRSGKLIVRTISYSAIGLAADVDLFRRAIASGDAGTARAIGGQLFARVLAPGLAEAPGTTRLLIAPDGPLGDLPLGLLEVPESGRYLLEALEIAYVPDVRSLETRTVHRAGSVLAVGYNGNVDDSGPRLQAAEDEAARVAARYQQRSLLVGRAATPAAISALAGDRDVIHIAAHADANRFAPWLSSVRLARAADGAAGLLRFGAAAGWNLRHCTLVVLSACDSAGGSRIRAFGTVNLASPFLSAGVRSVVGTLWSIDDRASTAFMQLFHQRVAAGESPISALRAAQLEALASGDPSLSAPSLWGAWVVYTRQFVGQP